MLLPQLRPERSSYVKLFVGFGQSCSSCLGTPQCGPPRAHRPSASALWCRRLPGVRRWPLVLAVGAGNVFPTQVSLFEGVTEPGSHQAPGAAARCVAPPRETRCLFTVAGLTCWWPPPLQKEAHRASHPLWASKAFYPPLTIRKEGLPEFLAALVPVGWLCVAAGLDGGSISSQLNIRVSGFPLAQWLCK